MNQDEQHLKLLSIFHYIVGGIIALFACFPIIHLIVGIVMVFSPQTMESAGESPPAFIGWFFILFAGLFIVIGWALAACVIATGLFLAQHRRYTFCLVIAAIECLFMPFGTVLGIFTIIVLVRESVKEMFKAA